MRTRAHEDFSYTLVMRKTGKQATVYGTPVWAQDKSRFLTVACSLRAARIVAQFDCWKSRPGVNWPSGRLTRSA